MIKEGSKKTVRCIGICFHKSTGNSSILHSNENRIEFTVEQTIKNLCNVIRSTDPIGTYPSGTDSFLRMFTNIMSQTADTACSRCDFFMQILTFFKAGRPNRN